MDVVLLKKNLDTKIIGKNIQCYEKIDSTNDEAIRLAKGGAKEGTVVISEVQTSGKGRLGRQWSSKKGESLTFSVIIKPHVSLYKTFTVTLLGVLSAVRAVRWKTGLEAKLKWPNDIVVHDKKVGGVLSEAVPSKKGPDSIIVGIGINVNNSGFPSPIKNTATSLKLESGRKIGREEVCAAVLSEFEKLYSTFLSGEKKQILDEWRTVSWTLGKIVSARTNKGDFKGEAVNLGEAGELIIKSKGGRINKLKPGQVIKLDHVGSR